jgi:hypothetical protein
MKAKVDEMKGKMQEKADKIKDSFTAGLATLHARMKTKERCITVMQDHTLFGIFYTGGDDEHFAIFEKHQRILVLFMNAGACLFISSCFAKIDVMSECGIAPAGPNGTAAALDTEIDHSSCVGGAEKWLGLTISKTVYQILLGKYLVVYLLTTYASQRTNQVAYLIFTLSITACIVMFLQGVDSPNRVGAAVTACALFIIDLFILETIMAYLMTFICKDKRPPEDPGADDLDAGGKHKKQKQQKPADAVKAKAIGKKKARTVV